MTYQPDLWRLPRAQVAGDVLTIGFFQRHRCLSFAAVKQGAHGPAAIDLVAAHAKANLVVIEVGHQPGRRTTPIQHQYIIRAEFFQCLKQHLTLSRVLTMRLCVQRQLSARQKQTEKSLVGAGGKTLEICACSHRWKEDRSISSDNSQTLPALNQPQTISGLHDKGVQSLQGVPGKVITCFGKSSV